jgi:hypothetical protein
MRVSEKEMRRECGVENEKRKSLSSKIRVYPNLIFFIRRRRDDRPTIIIIANNNRNILITLRLSEDFG